tara:strand:- start:1194 stop:1343 length:150 start_codon:yes stop_codon:yes gene_type:complete
MKTEERDGKLAQIRWLQVKELKIKYPNDADLGTKVRELVNKHQRAYENY